METVRHQPGPARKLLLTGASGFLGWYIGQAAMRDWQVYGVCYHHPISDKLHPIVLDLTSRPALRACFDQVRPDALIHAAALSQPNACQDNPDWSYQINVLASWRIAEECARLGIPCVFTSSEQVFDGTQAPYRETDPRSPLNVYGEHKAMAEVGMLERYDRVAVCRMPLMFGAAPQRPSFIQPFIQRLRSGILLQAFTDEMRMPLSGWDAAQGLLLALRRHQGIWHLGGKESLSRYAMAQILVDVLGIEQARIEPCKQADGPMSAPRPPDLSMDSTIAFELGFNPQDFRSGLMQIRDQL
jgi:dTDP-4-dehydrorhamnose reductase